MKQIKSTLLVALCATLFSFSSNLGGDSFTISIDGKEVIQQFVFRQTSTPELTLPSNAEAKIAIHYNHCGNIGKGRTLAVRNRSNTVIKEWKFIDNNEKFLAINADDIKTLFKSSNESLNLYYTSRELPDGHLLASIHLPQALVGKK